MYIYTDYYTTDIDEKRLMLQKRRVFLKHELCLVKTMISPFPLQKRIALPMPLYSMEQCPLVLFKRSYLRPCKA